MNELEEGAELTLDFDKIGKIAGTCPGVLPVALQNIDTGEVVLVAYTNETAFRKAIAERAVILWSTSRNELWEKGKTSGETFELVEVYVNCEQNSLLYRIRPRRKTNTAGRTAGICHTRDQAGTPRDCFYRRLDLDSMKLETVNP